jgi:hypothetical protein
MARPPAQPASSVPHGIVGIRCRAAAVTMPSRRDRAGCATHDQVRSGVLGRARCLALTGIPSRQAGLD